jgi:hypothetical protein
MNKEQGMHPERFEFDEETFDSMIAKEKASSSSKRKGMRQHMQEAGLDRLVVDYPVEMSSEKEVLEPIYGDYLLEQPK